MLLCNNTTQGGCGIRERERLVDLAYLSKLEFEKGNREERK
jgi:hypothetical protein